MVHEPEPEDPIVWFEKPNIEAVQRVLERAQLAAVRAGKKHGPKLTGGQGALSRALDQAMAHHGRTASTRMSIRRTASDTGGRPYHFGFSTVTKGKRAPKGSRSKGGGEKAAAVQVGQGHAGKLPRAAASGKFKAWTKESAHQAYAERDGAVERGHVLVEPHPLSLNRMHDLDAVTERENAENGRAAESGNEGAPSSARGEDRTDPGRTPSNGSMGEQDVRPPTWSEPVDGPEWQSPMPPTAMEWVEDSLRTRPSLSDCASEAAAQAYVEDGGKVARVRGTTSSFGTIGDTLAERMAFWDLVHVHESAAGGRTQSRLVLELPHEATAAARHEIVERYVKEFEDKGIPYWATIHEPTKRNDPRNYHAHVVLTDRPMARMPHPETGELVWDFTVEKTWKTKTSRNKRISHPHRQKRDPDMRDRKWVKKSRARFADVVNDVMIKHGVGVRYDSRSYKDMGLDVVPMHNVDRILADRSKTQRFVVMDPEWTRRMIAAELREAAIRRDETYQQLLEVERRIQEAARERWKTRKANELLPPHMALSPGRRVTPWMAERIGGRLLEVERDRLTAKFVDEATERTLAHVVEATGPKRHSRGEARSADGPNVPDPEALMDLNIAAREEMAAFAAERDARKRGYLWTRRRCMDAWSLNGGMGAGTSAQLPKKETRRPNAETGRPTLTDLRRGMDRRLATILAAGSPATVVAAAREMVETMTETFRAAQAQQRTPPNPRLGLGASEVTGGPANATRQPKRTQASPPSMQSLKAGRDIGTGRGRDGSNDQANTALVGEAGSASPVSGPVSHPGTPPTPRSASVKGMVEKGRRLKGPFSQQGAAQPSLPLPERPPGFEKALEAGVPKPEAPVAAATSARGMIEGGSTAADYPEPTEADVEEAAEARRKRRKAILARRARGQER